MHVLVADLHEHRAAFGQQVTRRRQPVAQIRQIGMDTVLPGISERLHLLRFARDVLGLVLHVAAFGGPLEIRIEPDAVGRVDVDALHLAAQLLAFRQRRHNLQGVAENHAVRPVGVVPVELCPGVVVRQPVEVREKIRMIFVPLSVSALHQVVDQRLGVNLLLDEERRRLNHEIRPVLRILAAPDQLRIEIAIAALVGNFDRVVLRHQRLVFRRRNVLPRRFLVRQRFDLLGGFARHHSAPVLFVPSTLRAALSTTLSKASSTFAPNSASISCTSRNSAKAHRP